MNEFFDQINSDESEFTKMTRKFEIENFKLMVGEIFELLESIVEIISFLSLKRNQL